MFPTYDWQLRDRTLTIGRRPLIMGIVNVTPDSFSDGGQFAQVDAAVAHGLQLVRDGADILDIGGESTRPGSEPVSLDDELRRTIPVVAELARQIQIPISIDTMKAEVARQAVENGASIINDVTALTGDPDMPAVASATAAGLVLMHMKGTPRTMQQNPAYVDVVSEIHGYLEQRLAALETLGIPGKRAAIDPGIGFGKKLEHNLELLGKLDRFLDLGRPICLGVSRKGFINRVLGRPGNVAASPAGTIGVLLHALSREAVQIARVHDVAATVEAVGMFVKLESNIV